MADRLDAADLFLPVTGNLLGVVVDASGVPQMGASVQLLNKYERLLAKTVTSGDGRFAFADLPMDSYSVRVSLSSFLPVSRDKIQVKGGADSMLQIHLATLLSSIEVRYVPPVSTMSEDWKWVLRSSPATRPITRWMPSQSAKVSGSERRHIPVFSDTRAVVSLSGGDTGIIDSDYVPADARTGFALSTNIFGSNRLRLSGTYGEGEGITPAAFSLSAVYSHDDSMGMVGSPEMAFSISQLALMGGASLNGSPSSGAFPQVRTMSISIYQTVDPIDRMHIEYGAMGESVDYLQHGNRVSPFARVTADLGNAGKVAAVYSDGGLPSGLITHQARSGAMAETTELSSDNAWNGAAGAVPRMPQVSFRKNRLELQRTKNYELGYTKMAGSRSIAFSAFHEEVSNGRLHVAGDTTELDPSDLLSDGVSTTSIYNIGRYHRNGYIVSANQRVNRFFDAAISYGRLGGFTVDSSQVLPTKSTPFSNTFLAQANHNIAVAKVQAKAPVMGTQLQVNYGWVEGHAVIPRHVFTTQDNSGEPGFNISIRQPLPPIMALGGRFELSADLYNLLAQGYLPVDSGDGHRVLIVQAPRTVRGGLKFVF